MDQTMITKLLRLMKLLTGNVSRTIDQLAREMGITPRTVYRYIDTIREAGFVRRCKKRCHLSSFQRINKARSIEDQIKKGKVGSVQTLQSNSLNPQAIKIVIRPIIKLGLTSCVGVVSFRDTDDHSLASAS